MKNAKGFILIYLMLFMMVVIISISFIGKLVSTNILLSSNDLMHAKSFYAAEAGIEWAKSKIVSTPSWFTDILHSPKDDITWLLTQADGYTMQVDDAFFKIIKEDGVAVLYSIGYTNQEIKDSRAFTILKIEFENSPFKQILWEKI